MSGKAERISTSINRLKKHQINLKDLEALNRLRNTPRPVASSAFSGSSAAGDVGGQGNFLSLDGGGLNGPLSLKPPVDFSVEIDSNGAIDIGPKDTDEQNSSNIQLEDIQPNTFTLDTIDGAVIDGQLLFVRTFAPSSTFTIAQGTLGNGGNIQTPDGTDVTSIGDLQIMLFMYDELLNIETNTEGTWRLLNTFGTGGGGLSEPVILTINTITPQTLPTTSVVDWSNNPNQITLDRDVEFSFSNLPASGSYEGVLVIIDVDGTGGFAAPIWPASLTNPPTVSTIANTRTSVMLYTIDGGTIVTHATSVGSSSSGATALSQLTIDTNKDWLAQGINNFGSLTGVTAVQYVDTGSTVRGSISGDLGTTSLRLSTASGGKFLISDVITDIAEFDDTTGLTMLGSHVINMGNNIINTIAELQFSNANTHTPSNELTIAFDTVDDALKYAVPLTTDSHRFYADTDLLASFSRVGTNEGLLSIQAVTAAFLQATETLFLSTFNNTSPTNGDVWRDSGDGKFKFRQNGVTDEIGDQSAIVDGNTSATVLDSAPSFAVVLNGIQKYSISNTRVDYEELDLFGITQINMNDSGANLISTLSATATGLNLNIISSADVYDLQIGSADAFHVDTLRTRILSTTPNTTDPELSLFRDDPSPTINDDIGTILFEGRNSAAEQISYGVIGVGATNVTDTTESGVLVANIFDSGLSVQQFRLEDGALRIRKFSSVAADVAALNLEKEDATPIANDSVAEINFNINDSGIITTYASIGATVLDATDNAALTFFVRANNGLISAMAIQGDDNNQRFQMLMSGTTQARIQPVFDRMGYFVTPQVTDFSLVLGTGGSLEIPRLANNSPSLTDLNQAFGAFDGAFGYESVDERLYVRESSTRWVFFSAAGAVT